MAEASGAFDNPGVTTIAHRPDAGVFPWTRHGADDRHQASPAPAVA